MAGDLHPIFFVEELVKAIGLVDAHGYSLIPGQILHAWVVMGVLIALSIMATKKLSLVPKGLQNFFELLIETLENFVVANMGESGRKVFPVLATLFIFILFSNYEGLIPGLDAPTANINTTLAMAVFVFVYYQYWGFKLHGFHYVHHFTGPVAWLAPLIFPIEVIGHFARMLSLSLRLFGNIKGEEIVLVLLFMLAPVVSTVPIYFLFMLLKVIQALVFFMLSMLYLKGAFEEAH
ncbi:MAG: F0F1 ATP synthase subunit A [Desulfomicrobium sp.]|jgi:F-type H+-transporting ATPase subunit a|nr:F0F1 ATP synthase subunit A [Pseudomonadota bacterium]MBV1712260.1 F0F1 ATP synthase subunit A [Desulfomicrobium sp.]MBU4572897.1 F0F1 ATP synthase subunit A [Pseudomonadota bacterium]MBU4594893.1 F0F1 ATP synthase subunit A [Pseudomonadota bacterium]MBV1718468.1 F0F1 ATP synthase subunit A [Desulfomicrobium sp.]